MGAIAPFRVMAILAEAKRLEAAGREIVHMEIGEPDFASPEPVLAAGRAALDSGFTHYTPAAGLPALREAIAAYYDQRFGVAVSPQRILVTPGASGALQLACAVLLNPDDEVLIPDPSYPCNRHMAALFGARVGGLPVDPSTGYSIQPAQLAAALSPKVRLLMLASPANPTGATVDLVELYSLLQTLRTIPDSVLLCDEIYQGLQYDRKPETALALGADDLIVINSFSKYFGMTGWRVGWMVAPEGLVEPLERLAQNLFLAAPTPSQHAALAALSAETRELIEHRREAFQARRDFLYAALTELGFAIGPRPSGAFYLYADVSRHAEDALTFCGRLLAEAGVAVTPGVDFGCHAAHRHVRFAYTTSLQQLELGIERLDAWLRAGVG
jgi:aspartate/methionine/tyrosine aminotransferase